MRKPDFGLCENKDAGQRCNNGKVISTFVFATKMVQSLFFLNLKFSSSVTKGWFVQVLTRIPKTSFLTLGLQYKYCYIK